VGMGTLGQCVLVGPSHGNVQHLVHGYSPSGLAAPLLYTSYKAMAVPVLEKQSQAIDKYEF
ncbi:MAG: hypothetical protein KKH53_04800, partial [Gammaproteobacteria bacterium]|nr:hypothetical protein [Gammaproteobacteria bacterium]